MFHPAKTRGIWEYQANEPTVKLTVASSAGRFPLLDARGWCRPDWAMRTLAGGLLAAFCGVPSDREARSIAVFTLAMGTPDRRLEILSPVPRSLTFLSLPKRDDNRTQLATQRAPVGRRGGAGGGMGRQHDRASWPPPDAEWHAPDKHHHAGARVRVYTPPSSHTTCQAGIAATLAATRRLPGGQKFAHATLTAGSLSVSLW